MKDKVILYYQYFYRKISGKDGYTYTPTSGDITSIAKFIALIGEDVGESTLFEYFAYQFYYWHDKDTRFGKGDVRLNWIIGQKAYHRWKEKKSDWYSYGSYLHELYGVERSHLMQSKPKAKYDIDTVQAHEDSDRAMLVGTPEGLVHCSDFTTMYHPHSAVCPTCTNKQICMKMMSEKYSRLYKRRMEMV